MLTNFGTIHGAEQILTYLKRKRYLFSMGIIRNIRVLCDTYNLDYQNGSGIWPQELFLKEGCSVGIGSYVSNPYVNPSMKVPFALPDGVLPENTLLEFPDQSNLYVVIGENGIGKTTFLRTIARALANARHFETHKRTRLFQGVLGSRESVYGRDDYFKLPEANTGGFVRIGLSYLRPDFIQHPGGRLREEELEKRVRDKYIMKAMRFYVSRSEVFDSPYYITLQRFSPEDIAGRLSYHIHRCDDDRDEEREKYKNSPLPSHVKKVMQEIAQENKLDFDEVVRRFCYLIEMANLILQRDLPINVYGEYELELRLPANKIEVGVFDHNLQPDGTMSKGQYARSSLEAFLEKEESGRVLLIDEPTGNTDMSTSAWVYNDWLPKIASAPHTDILIASHDSKLCEIVKELDGLSVNMYQRPAQVTSIHL